MQIGEGKAKVGDTLDHTFHTMAGVPYQVKFCPCCNTLFREVMDTDEEPAKE